MIDAQTMANMAAVYAALISTFLGWFEWHKYKNRGAQVRVDARKDKMIIPDPEYNKGTLWVSVSVTNVGDQPATITSLGCSIYKNRFMRWKKKPDKCFAFANLRFVAPLPIKLSPGEEWRPLVKQESPEQDIDLGISAQEGVVMFEIGVAHLRKPVQTRLS